MAIGVRHQLVGFFGCRIEADRVIDAVMLGERHLGIAAIDAGAGGVNQMLHLMMAAAFKDIDEADQIAIYVRMRVLD